ncbi:MAG: type III restriction-modification system endonuclease, partial [Sphingobacteriales bacterium]
MELILQTGLDHQQKPVEAISNSLKDVLITTPTQYFENPSFDLNDSRINTNIKSQQDALKVHSSIRGHTTNSNCLNLDIKMETGTGKTYVYTHAMYELHKQFGINKFIIAVPTLPIKAGAQQFLADPYVQRHFHDTRGYNTNIELYVLKPVTKKKGKSFFPSVVRAFFDGSFQNKNKIYVLLVNMQL